LVLLIQTINIGGTDWKKRGGMTRVDLGGTKDHPIKIRWIIIGGRQVFGRANKFAPIDLSS
jgi:hypothetical protein